MALKFSKYCTGTKLPRKCPRPLLLVAALACFQIQSRLEATVVVVIPPEPITLSVFGISSYLLDFNEDETDDLAFSGSGILVDVTPEGSNRVLIDDQLGVPFASELVEGSFIGSEPETGMIWQTGQIALSGCASGGGGVFCRGNFLGGIGFLGVEFDIAGATHYGWVEIESSQFIAQATLLRWAYETYPVVSIRAGAIREPATLSLVLACLACLLLRRNRHE